MSYVQIDESIGSDVDPIIGAVLMCVMHYA